MMDENISFLPKESLLPKGGNRKKIFFAPAKATRRRPLSLYFIIFTHFLPLKV